MSDSYQQIKSKIEELRTKLANVVPPTPRLLDTTTSILDDAGIKSLDDVSIVSRRDDLIETDLDFIKTLEDLKIPSKIIIKKKEDLTIIVCFINSKYYRDFYFLISQRLCIGLYITFDFELSWVDFLKSKLIRRPVVKYL